MKALFVAVLLFLITLPGFAQVQKDLDHIGPFQEGYAAVQKQDAWGFINEEGELVVDYRNDLIRNSSISQKVDLGVASQRYPVFKEGRSIIRQIKNDIPYYGYIDTSGKTVIEPQFLNVSSFSNGKALALKVDEEELGKNTVLGKRVVSYKYDVVLIDDQGEVLEYLAGPFPVSVSRQKLRTPPEIAAKRISENLVAVKGTDNRWMIFRL